MTKQAWFEFYHTLLTDLVVTPSMDNVTLQQINVFNFHSQSEELRRTLADKRPDSGAVIHSLKQKILKLETQMREKESSYMYVVFQLSVYFFLLIAFLSLFCQLCHLCNG